MFKHILVPTDGSPASTHAMQQIMQFAQETQARITGLHVTTPYQFFAVEQVMVTETPALYAENEAKRARKLLDEVEQTAREARVPCDTLYVEDENPYDAIIRTATERGCDLIAMASHGRRGIRGMLLGSETQKVLTHSTIPVLVYR